MRSSGSMDALDELTQRGRGVVALRQLAPNDTARKAVKRSLLRAGYRRIRPGWYAAPGADAGAVAAVKSGGSLTCVSLLSTLPSVWVPRGDGHLHVRLRDPKPPAAGIRHHVLPGPRVPVLRATDDPSVAVTCAVKCLPRHDTIAIVDTMLATTVLEPHEAKSALLAAGSAGRNLLPLVNPSVDSGLESHMRSLLVSARIKFEVQVIIRDVGRVDFLVGDCLVIEVDGYEFHSKDAFEHDRSRDAILHQLGFTVIRFSYNQVMNRPRHVVDTVLAAMAAGRHKWRKSNAHWRRLGAPEPVIGVQVRAVTERWRAIQ